MLDVHPPHHAAHSWRDFFIHIATIVIGLLVAIGLEQTVEHFHHRHLAGEARELLRVEKDKDRRSLDIDIYTTERHQRDLRRDLGILRTLKTHAQAPNQPFIIRRFSYGFFSEAWKNIHESGTINYLTPQEVQGLDYRYTLQDEFSTGARESGEALAHAAYMLTGEVGAIRTSSQSIAGAQFIDAVGNNHGMVDEDSAERGYAPLVVHADLSQLTPTELSCLEKAIKIAIVDDDALLSICFNIKRVVDDGPEQQK
jgi:hypothetical protein